MTQDEKHALIARVMNYADQLGLHGVVILSPVCATCGDCHDFTMLSDMEAGDAETLVQHWAERAVETPPVAIDSPGRLS
jgi:hypothetical protein